MNILNFLKTMFNKFVKAFREFLDEALPIAQQIIIAQLKDIAIHAVAELALTDLSNEEKRKAAFDKIKQHAKLKGLEAKDSILNLLVEMAVARLKNL